MIKKIFSSLIIVIGLSNFLACSLNQKDKIGIIGYIEDELGNPLNDVSISYKTPLISVQTDSIGRYTINESRTLLIEFKKEGYHTLSTKINNFSEDGSYNFNTVVLKKISSAGYKDISINTKDQSLTLSGNVLNIFKKPLKNVRVTLTDSITKSTGSSTTGTFHFRKYENQITFKKEGFKEISIKLPVYEKDIQNITLLKNLNKKGIYIIKSDKYIPLPQTKLSHKSEEKVGRILWGGNFAYNETDFFYPDEIKEFKIEHDTIIRFVIFEPNFSSHLYEAKSENGYLCTASYKLSKSPFPSTKSVDIREIYPSEYSRGSSNTPKVIEFNPSNTGINYVFVNSENKKGYYFTY